MGGIDYASDDTYRVADLVRTLFAISVKVMSGFFWRFHQHQGCAIDCNESGTPQEVSFGRARDIMVRVFTAFLEYQTVILHYHD
jgi:hypothetical protein